MPRGGRLLPRRLRIDVARTAVLHRAASRLHRAVQRNDPVTRRSGPGAWCRDDGVSRGGHAVRATRRARREALAVRNVNLNVCCCGVQAGKEAWDSVGLSLRTLAGAHARGNEPAVVRPCYGVLWRCM